MSLIPFEDALNTKFEASTREELLAYCQTLGLEDINPGGDVRLIKNKIFEALGVNYRENGPEAPKSARPAFKSAILPPVNLTPNGKWGGRRRRIKLPRPEGTKVARSEGFGWNGKATYWLAYDEVVAVPYPIYMIIIDNKRRTPKQIKTTNPDGAVEITTGWDFHDVPITDLGDDPMTAGLPTSMAEWYQDKGVTFFEKLKPRDLQTVATRLDINIRGEDRKTLPREDILELLLVFLYGAAPSSYDPEAAIEEAVE